MTADRPAWRPQKRRSCGARPTGIAPCEIQQGGKVILPSALGLPGCGAEVTAGQQMVAHQRRRPMQPAVIVRESGRSSIPETSAMKWIGRGVLDTPQEPVIGLA
jgi:hypothetical protein